MNPGSTCEPSQGAHYQQPSDSEEVSIKHPQKPHKYCGTDLQKVAPNNSSHTYGSGAGFPHCKAEAKLYTCRTCSAKEGMGEVSVGRKLK